MNNREEENLIHDTQNISQKQKRFLNLKKETKELIRFIIIAGCIIVPFRIFIAQPFIVNGASMDPTFETNQYLIVDQLTYRTEEPQRGDIVIFRFPLNPKDFYIKRIIGLPGETVSISGSDVYIREKNSQKSFKLDEPYIEFTSNNSMSTTLRDDEFFVMGDNRPNSSDSRHWGVLPRKFIVGKAFLRLLPINKADLFPGKHFIDITDQPL